jgi:hypothetical protein
VNRDLVDQLDAYFSQVDERQGPVTADQIAEVIDKVHALPPAPVPVRQRPRVWVAAAAAALVLVAIGVAPLLVGSQDADTPPATEATVATTAPTTTTPSTAAARAQGAVFDSAEHDLCKWFDSDEITEIVSDAYAAAGATTLPDSFGAGHPSTYPPFTCGWATEETDMGSAGWDGTGYYFLLVSMDPLRYPAVDPVLGTLSGGEVSVTEETESRSQGQWVDDSYEPPDTVSDGLSLVGAHARDLGAWTPPGPPARWLFIDQMVQVEGRSEIYLSISVISNPPLEFTSGSKAHRLVDVGLAIADTLLQRLNWLPSSNPTENGGNP